MEREWTWRGIFIALITLGALYLLVPSYYYFSLPPDKRNDPAEFEKAVPKWARLQHLNLGLDLQGGVHLVMKVDVDAAMTAKVTNRATEIEDYLVKKGFVGTKAKRIGSTNRVDVTAPAGKESEVETAATDYYNDMQRVAVNGDVVTYEFKPEAVKSLKDGAVEQSIKAIRNRVTSSA